MQILQLEVREQLLDLYLHQGLTVLQIARKLGVSRRTTNNWIYHYGIPKRPYLCTIPVELTDKEWLNEMYTYQQKSTREIGRIVNASGETVRRWLKYHNIVRRSCFITRC